MYLHILFEYEHEYVYTLWLKKKHQTVSTVGNMNYQGHELWLSLHIYPQS